MKSTFMAAILIALAVFFGLTVIPQVSKGSAFLASLIASAAWFMVITAIGEVVEHAIKRNQAKQSNPEKNQVAP
ncbi:MAG TPA: hypothetical protein VFT82_02570 [Candidatus Paceibacterota bacterium]|nr:hypothetical protein [Candidatus Paceibacterota bacterium]